MGVGVTCGGGGEGEGGGDGGRAGGEGGWSKESKTTKTSVGKFCAGEVLRRSGGERSQEVIGYGRNEKEREREGERKERKREECRGVGEKQCRGNNWLVWGIRT